MSVVTKPKISKFQIILLVLLIVNLLATGWLMYSTKMLHKAQDIDFRAQDVMFRTFDVYQNEFDYIEKQLKKLDTDIKYQSMQKK